MVSVSKFFLRREKNEKVKGSMAAIFFHFSLARKVSSFERTTPRPRPFDTLKKDTMPLDALSRRLLRRAVLLVHPDVFSGEEAASFNAESLVVRRETRRRRMASTFDLSVEKKPHRMAFAVSRLASLFFANASDRCQKDVVFII